MSFLRKRNSYFHISPLLSAYYFCRLFSIAEREFISASTHLCVHAAMWINISMLSIYLNVPLSPSVSQTAQNRERKYTGKWAALISVGSECHRLSSNFQCHSK